MLSIARRCNVVYAPPVEETVAFAWCRGEERRVTAASALEAFIHPRSIAVVGASERVDAWGRWLFQKLLTEGFPGRLYPINRQAQMILGQPAYAQVSAVPGPVDLAIIAIPVSHIFETIRDCAAKGVKACLIITAGFSEARQDGRAQEQAMVAYARAHGMRLVGPNVSGIINLHDNLLPTLQNAPTCTRHR
jgi:acyl-CoA synthetase (NDP forming)